MDETPVYFDLVPGNTISQTGVKSVRIRSTGAEKRHITAVLAVSAAGNVLPPMVIFKGKRELKLNVPKDWIVCVQEKAWMDETLMLRWINEIYRKHTKKQPSLCVLDAFRGHRTEKVKKLLNKFNAKIAMNPGGCTSKLQPLDVCINKPFKHVLKQQWAEFIRNSATEMIDSRNTDEPIERLKSADKQTIIDWIAKGVRVIREKTELVKKSFLVTGIANALNGRDDHILRNDEFIERYFNDSDESDTEFDRFTPDDLPECER